MNPAAFAAALRGDTAQIDREFVLVVGPQGEAWTDAARDVAAKTGLAGLARALAADLGPHGITVNALAPGYVPTAGNAGLRATDPGFMPRIAGRTPLGRWGEPAEVAAVAMFLASSESSYITGQTIYPDGGRLGLNYTVPVRPA